MAQYGKPLRRVALEDDDEIRTLEGEDAKRWMDAVNSRVVFLAFHAGFGEFPAFPWKIEPKRPTQET